MKLHSFNAGVFKHLDAKNLGAKYDDPLVRDPFLNIKGLQCKCLCI